MLTLHKSAAILVTSDAKALDEAQATDAGRLCIGPRLSATVAWVDHTRVPALCEGLARAGFMPQLSREGQETNPDR